MLERKTVTGVARSTPSSALLVLPRNRHRMSYAAVPTTQPPLHTSARVSQSVANLARAERFTTPVSLYYCLLGTTITRHYMRISHIIMLRSCDSCHLIK